MNDASRRLTSIHQHLGATQEPTGLPVSNGQDNQTSNQRWSLADATGVIYNNLCYIVCHLITQSYATADVCSDSPLIHVWWECVLFLCLPICACKQVRAGPHTVSCPLVRRPRGASFDPQDGCSSRLSSVPNDPPMCTVERPFLLYRMLVVSFQLLFPCFGSVLIRFVVVGPSPCGVQSPLDLPLKS